MFLYSQKEKNNLMYYIYMQNSQERPNNLFMLLTAFYKIFEVSFTWKIQKMHNFLSM